MDNMNVNSAEVKEMGIAGSGKGLIVVAVIGGIVLAGGVVYKFVIKPLTAKHRAKKEAKVTEPEAPAGV